MPKNPKNRIKLNDVRYRLLDISVEATNMDDILDVLGSAIRASGARIKNATAESADYGEFVTDDECALIEDLLGTAYVVCQRYAKSVEARALRILNAKFPKGHAWRKGGLLRYGPRMTVEGMRLTQMQVVDAAANYFKHGDSWAGPWDELKKTPKRHATRLKAAGMEQYCTGQFRQIAERLGNTEYSDTRIFGAIVHTWAKEVRQLLRRQH